MALVLLGAVALGGCSSSAGTQPTGTTTTTRLPAVGDPCRFEGSNSDSTTVPLVRCLGGKWHRVPSTQTRTVRATHPAIKTTSAQVRVRKATPAQPTARAVVKARKVTPGAFCASPGAHVTGTNGHTYVCADHNGYRWVRS